MKGGYRLSDDREVSRQKMDNRITIIYGNEPFEMTLSLMKAVKVAAGIPAGARIGTERHIREGGKYDQRRDKGKDREYRPVC